MISGTVILKWLLGAFGLSAVDMFVDKSAAAIMGSAGQPTTPEHEGSARTLEADSRKAKKTKDDLYLMLALTEACLKKTASRLGFGASNAVSAIERQLIENVINGVDALVLERISDLIGNAVEEIRTVNDVVIRNDLGATVLLGMVMKARQGYAVDYMATTHPIAFMESIKSSLNAGGAYNTSLLKFAQGFSTLFENACKVLGTIPSTDADFAIIKQKIADAKRRNSRI